MLRHVVVKELRLNLLSWRFIAGLATTVALMGLVGQVLVKDFSARRQTYLDDVRRHREELEGTKVYSYVEVTIDIPPSPLSVFSRGNPQRPTTVTASPWEMPSLRTGGVAYSIDAEGSSDRPDNVLLRVFTPIDLTFVIGTVLSLFAILLVFDGFSGERERGLLALLLANPVARSTLLLGKFMGALATLGVPLTVGFLEVLLLWALTPGVTISRADWVGMGLIFFTSLLFLSAVIALGLVISLYCRESSTGLISLLLVWVLLVVGVPQGVGQVAKRWFPWGLHRTTVERLQQSAARFFNEIKAVPYQQRSRWGYHSEGMSEVMHGVTSEEAENRRRYNLTVVPIKLRFVEEQDRIGEQEDVALWRWHRLREPWLRLSIHGAFAHAVRAIAGTDIESYAATVRAARRYRDSLMEYLRPKMTTHAWFTRVMETPPDQGWDDVAPLNLSALPRPQVALPALTQRLGRVVGDVVLLIIATALCLGLAAHRVNRYPV